MNMIFDVLAVLGFIGLIPVYMLLYALIKCDGDGDDDDADDYLTML